jgi:hypothetical protein
MLKNLGAMVSVRILVFIVSCQESYMKRIANIASLILGAAGIMATSISVAAPVPDGVYYIKAEHSGKCVHQNNATQADGGNVTQWDCVDQPNVKIEKISAGGGYFMLRFQHSGKCVTVESGDGQNGTNIIQETCDSGWPPKQTWMEIPGQGNFVKIQSSIGHCLHQDGATLGNGDNITAWECGDQPNIRFEFVLANPSMTDKSGAPTIPSDYQGGIEKVKDKMKPEGGETDKLGSFQIEDLMSEYPQPHESNLPQEKCIPCKETQP